MNRNSFLVTALFVTLCITSRGALAADAPKCPADNCGLSLPAGFCATVFADHLGHARH
jgi:hypothetical protein